MGSATAWSERPRRLHALRLPASRLQCRPGQPFFSPLQSIAVSLQQLRERMKHRYRAFRDSKRCARARVSLNPCPLPAVLRITCGRPAQRVAARGGRCTALRQLSLLNARRPGCKCGPRVRAQPFLQFHWQAHFNTFGGPRTRSHRSIHPIASQHVETTSVTCRVSLVLLFEAPSTQFGSSVACLLGQCVCAVEPTVSRLAHGPS